MLFSNQLQKCCWANHGYCYTRDMMKHDLWLAELQSCNWLLNSNWLQSFMLHPPGIIFLYTRRPIGLWDIGCVHKGTNHVPKDVSDRDLLRDWDRDLNYVRSHASQTPSQSRTGSAHCEVKIFCSYCAVRADWPMHGLSVHFQNAHAWITFRNSFAFTCPRIRLSTRITIQNDLLFQKHVSKAWFEKALCSQRIKSGFQIRKGPNHVPKCLSEHDSFPCEQALCVFCAYFLYSLSPILRIGETGVTWAPFSMFHIVTA